MQISKSSLVYYFINTYGQGLSEYDDSCSFIKKLVQTTFIFLIMILIGGCFVGVIFAPIIAWIVAYFVIGYVEPSEHFYVGISFLIGIPIVIGSVYLTEKYKERTRRRVGILRQIHDHVHKKYCSKLQIVD